MVILFMLIKLFLLNATLTTPRHCLFQSLYIHKGIWVKDLVCQVSACSHLLLCERHWLSTNINLRPEVTSKKKSIPTTLFYNKEMKRFFLNYY